MTQHTVQSMILLPILAMMLALTGFAEAATTVTFDHAGPIVAGEQRYAGGRMELVPVNDGALVALRIEGWQVALYFVEGGRIGSTAEARIVLAERGSAGHEIVALRDPQGREARLRLAVARRAPTSLMPPTLIAQGQ